MTLAKAAEYPPARRDGTCEERHGHRLTDPYRWLEDPADEATAVWVAQQRGLSERILQALPGSDRLLELLESLDVGPTESPVKSMGDRRFRASRDDTDTWSVEAALAPDAPWHTVFSPGRRSSAVWRWDPSPQGRLLAVQVVDAGAEATTPLTVVDVDTGSVVDATDLTRYSHVEWLPDESAYYLVRRHLDRAGTGVYLHRVGADPANDALVIGDDDPFTRYQVTLWHGRWLVVGTRYGTNRAASVAVLDTGDPGGRLVPVLLDGTGAGGVLVGTTGRLLAVSTARADFGELLVCPAPDDEGYRRWDVLVPEMAPQSLAGVTVLPDHHAVGADGADGAGGSDRLVLVYAVDGGTRMAVHDSRTGSLLTPVHLPGHGTVSAVRTGSSPATLVVVYSDWVTALSVWEVDVRTGRTTPVGSVQSLHDRVRVTRTTYRSADGTPVPLTVLSPRDEGPRSPRPAVLTCYGGFGIPFRASWQPEGLSWVLAGGVMAVAGVRGGGERGRAWHRAGTGPGRLTTLADLHAAADALVAEGWTTRDHLALMGGSNGGLMVAAAAAQHPEAYAALAVSGAPLDMLRYELSGLGPAWREEYGSAADPEAFGVLRSYSPYHNVPRGRRFPPSLFSVGANDTRVDALHSRKMVARLQAETTGGPALLTVVDGAGHVGGGDQAGRTAARMLAFVAASTGLEVRPQSRSDAAKAVNEVRSC